MKYNRFEISDLFTNYITRRSHTQIPNFVSFPMALWSNASHDLLVLDVSRSHSDKPQSVGLLWTSDQLVAETST